MPRPEMIAEILRLSAAERLALSAAIWDSFAKEPTSVPVPDWHREIVADRLSEDDTENGPVQTWPALRLQIERRG
jgi:putative addiction module component (TIGR02574 family)